MHDAPTHEGLLAVSEVCQLLGVTEYVVWQLCSRGQLTRVKLSHRIVRFRRQDVEDLVQRRLLAGGKRGPYKKKQRP